MRCTRLTRLHDEVEWKWMKGGEIMKKIMKKGKKVEMDKKRRNYEKIMKKKWKWMKRGKIDRRSGSCVGLDFPLVTQGCKKRGI